jgi:hypothetical protein
MENHVGIFLTTGSGASRGAFSSHDFEIKLSKVHDLGINLYLYKVFTI